MAFALSRVCAAARRRTTNKELAKYMELDYARHMPKAYIDKVKGMVPHLTYEERFGAPTHYRYFGNRKRSRADYVQTPYRPWEHLAMDENMRADLLRSQKGPEYRFESHKYSEVTPLPDERWVFFVGDKVRVMVGADAGKDGYVTYVSRDTNQVIVGGMHTKRKVRDELVRYGVRPAVHVEEQFLDVEKEEVMLLDPSTNEPVRVEWQYAEVSPDVSSTTYDVVRVSATGQRIPIPAAAHATYEYVTPSEYVETDKDTAPNDVLEETYEKKLCTFEADLEKAYDLEPRKHKQNTYWY